MDAPPSDPLCEATPDEDLVESVCSGDPAPFDILYRRYFPRVFRFVARRLGNRADTEETVQEVFINLFSSLASFRGEAPFAAWVFGLTRRTVASRFKRRRAELIPLLGDEDEAVMRLGGVVSREPDPLEAYECRERLGRLSRAVREDLSPEQWQLFYLHHLEHRSIHDIACQVRKSEDAVKSHLYRARKTLLAR